MFKTFDQMTEIAMKSTEKKTMGIVASHDEHTIEATFEAMEKGVIVPVLYGFAEKTKEYWAKIAGSTPMPELVACETLEECVAKAMADVNSGKLQCIMKGIVDTAIILRGVLNSETGIKGKGALSQFGIMEAPGYHKIFAMTDAGLNVAPNLEQKKDILENAVWAMRALGVEKPKVAVLTAIEKLNPKMQATVDAAELKTMWQNGEIENCIVEGPISYDIAMDPEAGAIKGYESPVNGDADILIMPDIHTGNIAAKAVMVTGGAKSSSVVIGAKVPIALNTRGATAADKFYTIVLAAMLGVRD